MYKSVYYDKKNSILHLWDDESGYIKTEYKNFAFKRCSNGSFKNLYGDNVEKVYYFDEYDPRLFESDLPVETKALIDIYGDHDDAAKNIKSIIIDIETSTEGGFPSMITFDKAITSIAIYDKTTKVSRCLILDDENKITPTISDTLIIQGYKTEDDLLEAILEYFEETRPDVVTGWNIAFNGDNAGFDIPYIYGRIKKIKGREVNRLSPIGVTYVRKKDNSVFIAGMNCIDYMLLYKKFRFEPRATYRLDYIGKVEVGKGKVHYKGSLHDLYTSDIKKFIEYNLVDIEIVRLLDEKFQFLDLAINVCHIGHVPYEWYHMSSRFIEGAIITYMRRNGNIVAPNKPVPVDDEDALLAKEPNSDEDEDSDGNDDTFIGAYVKDPVPGLYSWVCSADINSLYPSVIRCLNISPETFVGKVSNWDSESYMRGEISEVKIADENYTIDEFKDFIKKENITVSAIGALYNNNIPGIIPSILDLWFQQRLEFKDLVKKYSKEGNKPMEEFYNRRQHVQKIFLNSVYGILGLSTCRFYSKDNAESVTVTGQTIIKTSEKIVARHFKEFYQAHGKILKDESKVVVYIDTDSLYFSVKDLIDMENITSLEDKKNFTISTCKNVVDLLNSYYPVMVKKMFNADNNKIKIVADTINRTAFWKKKKAYALNKIYDMDKGKDISKIEVKGLSSVRSSYPVKFKEFLEAFFKKILNEESVQTIDEDILNLKTSLETSKIEDIAKNSGVKFMKGDGTVDYNPKSRRLFELIKGTPSQAKAALCYNDLLIKLGLTKVVTPIYTGQKIKYVYLKQNEYGLNALAFKADDTDPQEILDFIEKYCDKNKMYVSEMEKKLADFYNILKWELPSFERKKAQEFFDF